jgi:DNA-binding MarR family transcriptional regulator
LHHALLVVASGAQRRDSVAVGATGRRRLTVMAEHAHVTKQTMSALVDHLERAGYVARVADPDDGRAACVRLTARGEAFARNARAFARRFEAGLAERVGARRVEALRATLRVIHESFAR